MRLGLAGLLAAGGLMTALSLAWIGLPSVPGSTTGEGPWQVQELAFLKAAYDRTQQDVLQQDNSGEGTASASLYAEQERIVRQMREVARLLPDEAIPEELRDLLRDAGASSAVPQSGETTETDARVSDTNVTQVPDLRIGLHRATGDDGSGPPAETVQFAVDPELREPIRPEPATSGTTRRKPRDDDGREQR
jgi:hypothetical protein